MSVNITHLSKHGLKRLTERTNIREYELINLIDKNRCLNIGVEPVFNKAHWLFYSERDNDYFVAIRDEFTGEVVTILTLEYHKNLAWAVKACEKHHAKRMYVTHGNHKCSTDMLPSKFKVKLRYTEFSENNYGYNTSKCMNVCSIASKDYDDDVDNFVKEYLNDDTFKKTLTERTEEHKIHVHDIVHDAILQISFGKKVKKEITLKKLYLM